jgi:hypothetical protein
LEDGCAAESDGLEELLQQFSESLRLIVDSLQTLADPKNELEDMQSTEVSVDIAKVEQSLKAWGQESETSLKG